MTRPLTPSPADFSGRHLLWGALGVLAVPLAPPALAAAEDDPELPGDAAFMRLAIEEAAQRDSPFGAVITRNGEILARGRDLGIQQKDPTANAEMVAIRRFRATTGRRSSREQPSSHLRLGRALPDVRERHHLVWIGARRLRRLDRTVLDQNRPDHGAPPGACRPDAV
jgi:hypothetical protein